MGTVVVGGNQLHSSRILRLFLCVDGGSQLAVGIPSSEAYFAWDLALKRVLPGVKLWGGTKGPKGKTSYVVD